MSGEYDIKVEALRLDSKRCMLTHFAKKITAALDLDIVLQPIVFKIIFSFAAQPDCYGRPCSN